MISGRSQNNCMLMHNTTTSFIHTFYFLGLFAKNEVISTPTQFLLLPSWRPTIRNILFWEASVTSAETKTKQKPNILFSITTVRPLSPLFDSCVCQQTTVFRTLWCCSVAFSHSGIMNHSGVLNCLETFLRAFHFVWVRPPGCDFKWTGCLHQGHTNTQSLRECI